MTITYSLEELSDIAEQVIAHTTNKIISFDGDMGVGKTTLIKQICKQLGVQDGITSPTYSLVNEYEGDEGPIYHFDFYRIEDEEEAYHIGFEEYLESGSWIFIEWPDRVKNILPLDIATVKIVLAEDGKRRITVA